MPWQQPVPHVMGNDSKSMMKPGIIDPQVKNNTKYLNENLSILFNLDSSKSS